MKRDDSWFVPLYDGLCPAIVGMARNYARTWGLEADDLIQVAGYALWSCCGRYKDRPLDEQLRIGNTVARRDHAALVRSRGPCANPPRHRRDRAMVHRRRRRSVSGTSGGVMSDNAARPGAAEIAGRVTLGLTMIDRGRAAIIRDRYWRERTWPCIAKERHCSVTTAVKRFKQGMDDLRRAILLVEGRLPK